MFTLGSFIPIYNNKKTSHTDEPIMLEIHLILGNEHFVLLCIYRSFLSLSLSLNNDVTSKDSVILNVSRVTK